MVDGAPGEIRTPDPLVRSQVLYPAELRAHVLCMMGQAYWSNDPAPFQESGDYAQFQCEYQIKLG